MIHTAGEILTESRLRALAKCSEFFVKGGEVNPTLQAQIAFAVAEQLVSLAVQKPELSVPSSLTRLVLNACYRKPAFKRMFKGEQDQMVGRIIRWLDQFLTLFSLDKYRPLMSSLNYKVKVSKTIIQLKTSGIHIWKDTQQLHLLNFTPYTPTHAQLNDPVIPLKLKTMKAFARKMADGRNRQVKLHMFGMTESGSLSYNSYREVNLNNSFLTRVEGLVKVAEIGYSYPRVPCYVSCVFKEDCYL